MKKVYEKPAMEVERFALSQTIAACDIKIGFQNSLCVINDEDATEHMVNLAFSRWFIAGCLKIPYSGVDENGICYHTNTNAAFNS